MESLALDAADAELLLLDDATLASALALEPALGDELLGGRYSGPGEEQLADATDESIEELLALTDSSALVLSTDAPEPTGEVPDLLLGIGHAPCDLVVGAAAPPLSPPSSESSRSGSGSGSGSGGGNAERKPVHPPRRRRQKDELDYLRAKASELEAELERIKAREESGEPARAEALESWSSRPDAGLALAAPPKKKLLWQRVARSQLESRRRAQRENERLKDMVQGQLEVIQGLEKVLQKRAAMEGTDQWLADRKRVRVVHDSDAAVFERLKMDLDVRYAQTASVFAGNPYAAQKLDGDHVQVKADGADGMFLEFVASKIVPFDLAETSRMLWACFTRSHLDLKDGYYSMVDSSDDTLSAKMVLTVRQNGMDVLREAKFVVRRFREEHRCVLVWACQAETEGTLTKVNGVQMFDLGWSLVEPAPVASLSGGEGDELSATIMQSCARVKIKLTSALSHTQEDVIFLTDLVTGSYMRNLVGVHQAIEDMLVEEAVALAK